MVQQRTRPISRNVPGEFTRVYPKMVPFPKPQARLPENDYETLHPVVKLGVCPAASMGNIRNRIRRCMRVFHGNSILFSQIV